MCKACDLKDSLKLKAVYKAWVPYDKASHLVVAHSCYTSGIMASAADVVTAYRHARTFREHGFSGVHVIPNLPEEIKQVHEGIMNTLTGLL